MGLGVGKEKSYRNFISSNNLINFEVRVNETDLYIRAKKELREEARDAVLKYRLQVERYIGLFPEFRTALIPWEIDETAPKIIKDMVKAARAAKVGPMAAIAGAISECVGRELLMYTQDVILENGGDIFIRSSFELFVGIFAGRSPLSLKVRLKIKPEATPLGICTSSGTVGHSFSFGKADAVTVIAKSASLADAAATSIGNIVLTKTDINKGLCFAQTIEGISGVLIIVDDLLGSWGEVELANL